MSAAHPRPWHVIKRERPRGGYTLQIVDTNGEIVIHGIEQAEETLNLITQCVNEASR